MGGGVMKSSSLCAALAALLVSCGGDNDAASPEGAPSGSGQGGATATANGDGGKTDETDHDGGARGTASDAGSDGSDASHSEPGGPAPEHLPKVFGACPTFVGKGESVTFQTSRGPRPVRMWISDAAKTLDGPLVFYWHGWHGGPLVSGITNAALTELLDKGGIFVAPFLDPEAKEKRSDYWSDWDLITADQVVACAIATVGIDKRRIHSIGYSAGGMQTYRMIHERSGYLASAVMYSPGTNGPPKPRQETKNKIASIITWGDAEDKIFRTLAESYFDKLTSYGFFTMMCHHTSGHIQPGKVVERALDFLLEHPFGTDPSPFAGGIPNDYPSYCGLTK